MVFVFATPGQIIILLEMVTVYYWLSAVNLFC